MPTKRKTSKKRTSPQSVWHEEAHPTLTHALAAILAFFAGVLIVGALAVHAETSPSSEASSQFAELRIMLNDLTARVIRTEERLNALRTERIHSTDCASLTSALPHPDSMHRSSPACFIADDRNGSDAQFQSVTALYEYEDAEGFQTLTVQLYDFSGNSGAAEQFLADSAYVPLDKNVVKREHVQIGDRTAVFTYEGTPNDGRYTRAANWFLVNDRFGVLVHGSPLGYTDRECLNDLTALVDTEHLMSIGE